MFFLQGLSLHSGHRICYRCQRLIHFSIQTFTKTVPYDIKNGIWPAKEIRTAFLDYFCQKQEHLYVPSSSVIPKKGEGTYFTNAGMNQFKPLFLGTVEQGAAMSSYKRVANSQKCVRVGGKHNDLEDVGNDSYHHTFFEMLGNWSFGDYFKKEACAMALELLTEVYGIPRDKLFFTYFGGSDEMELNADLECKNIWLDLNIPEIQLLPFGMKDNFWDMGDTGPCGPCSEIHYNRLDNKGGQKLVNQGSPDVLEIWNLVFMQFNRQEDQSLTSLPSKHVDTGMGLERLAAVLQDVHSNYDTDLFTPIMKDIKVLLGDVNKDSRLVVPTRILADHMRMITACVSDGLLPGRSNLEHKLRTVIHRAAYQVRHCFNKPPGILSRLVDPVVETLGDTYPEMLKNQHKVKTIVSQTEEQYIESLVKGEKSWKKFINRQGGSGNLKVLTGQHIMDLHEGKYGSQLSLDIIEDMAGNFGLTMDKKGFNKIFQEHKFIPTLAEDELRKYSLTQEILHSLHCQEIMSTDDSHKHSYNRENGQYYLNDFHTSKLPKVTALVNNSSLVNKVEKGETCCVILDKTSFYAEAGGQMADIGEIMGQNGKMEIREVINDHGYILHRGHVVEDTMRIGEDVQLKVDMGHRAGCMSNHTATHLLNACLRGVLEDVFQRGSSVEADKFTFDFSCMSSINNSTVDRLEKQMIDIINRGLPVAMEIVSLEEAVQRKDILLLPNETYPADVTVISIKSREEDFNFQSSELCCGTHVLNTQDIESFCILKLTGVSQGTKRVVCVTGSEAVQAHRNGEKLREQYEQLETAVRSQSHPELWRDMVKQINKGLSGELVPKVVREEVQEKTEQLGASISTILNKLTEQKLQREVESLLNDNISRSYAMGSLSYGNHKQMIRALTDIDIIKPVIIVLETDGIISVVICTPEDCLTKAHKITEGLVARIGGRSSKQKRKGGKDFGIVHMKGKQTLAEICSKSQSVIEEQLS